MKKIEWILRIALCGEFLGHGWYAWQATANFQALLMGATGMSAAWAVKLLPVIGCLDFAVAAAALVKPLRVILLYAAVWGLLTALARPLSGETEIWAFIERWPNCAIPLALLWLRGIPRNDRRAWFR